LTEERRRKKTRGFVYIESHVVVALTVTSQDTSGLSSDQIVYTAVLTIYGQIVESFR
jgi:hypothetical protein